MLKKALLYFIILFLNFSVFSQDFISIWNTQNTEAGSSLINEVAIPTNPAFTYNYTVNWGDGSTDSNVTGDITHTYATQGLYTISINDTFPAIYFNDAGDKLKIIEILNWGNIQWQTMESAFYGCENLNFDAIPAPDLSQVTTLENMFKDCFSFNGIVNNWNISNVTNLASTFETCRIFNRPLDNWDTSSVTTLAGTFMNCYRFNEPLDNWNTASVVDMSRLFNAATQFNQNIENWNVSQVTSMASTFDIALAYTHPLNNWDVDNVTDMSRMFYRCRNFNQPLDNWNVGNVTTMREMFYGFLDMPFNQNINNWNVSNVTDMAFMFRRCTTFNQPLNNWDVSNVTDMSHMFEEAESFNQSIEIWNVSNVTNMAAMFNGSNQPMIFNQPLNSWDVSKVTDMSEMFRNADVFNLPLNNWSVSAVTNMSQMFRNNDAFNQPIENWDVSAVTNMEDMFAQNTAFNQPLNNWTTTSLTDISSIFENASSFNQPLNNWDVSKVTNMNGAFSSATSFNQDLGPWNITLVNNMLNMLSNSGISQANYDSILMGWSAQTVNTGLTLGATGLQYCDALTQRQSLIDDDGWDITGDAVNCPYVLCSNIISPIDGDQNVPANSSIRWEAAPNADGYNVSIRREDDLGNVLQIIADNQDFGNVLLLNFTNEFLPGDNVFVTVIPYNADGPAVGCQEISFKTVESWVNRTDVFKITIDTRNIDNNSSAANQYRIELNDGFPDNLVYNFNIDWGDGQYNNNVTNDIIHTYLNPGIYSIAIIGDFPSFRHFSVDRDNNKLISMDQWGSQVWRSMAATFYFCENMEYNATDVPNLSQVTSMVSMFRRCNLFDGDISNWDVSTITDMSSLFYQTPIFNQPLGTWNVSNVTNMRNIFNSATLFNQPLDSWDMENVTNINFMFAYAENFNQPLNAWTTDNITTMMATFQRADAFNQPLNNWNVSAVTNMEEMFQRAEAFNQNIEVWDVSNVTTIENMFQRALNFNQPLNAWDVSSVTNMRSTFSGAREFNQPLENWNVGAVTNMQLMFNSAASFNQDINVWNVTNVTNMQSMFNYALAFNQPLNSWDVNSVVNMASMFRGAQMFNQPLGNWNVSAVATTNSMFEDAFLFNQLIDTWDVSSVTIMESMFEGASVFNSPIENWNVASVTSMEAMFKDASLFNQPIQNWDTGEVQTMESMFSDATVFNQPINSWNTSFVRTMASMFENAINFNTPIEAWNVASVTTMESMFSGARVFNQNIDSWNVRAVTTTRNMFLGASAFNQPLNNWRVANNTDMSGMFLNATVFNQPLNNWNLGSVNLRNTFSNALAFNQYLGEWDVSNVNNMQNMLSSTALSRENYDNTLIAWSEQTLTPGINLGAHGLLYCDALEERQSMIDTYSWTINGDILDCPIPSCTQLISPLNGAIDVPVNTNLSWEPALYARGYRLTVVTQPGNITVVDDEIINNETTYEFITDFIGNETVAVTITPFNDEGNAIGCVQETFVISSDTTPSVPNCSALTSPLNSATDVVVDTDLEWTPITNADGYKISVGTTSGGIDILNNLDVGNSTTYDLPIDLAEDTMHYITIIPYNAEGDAMGCTEEFFTTEFIPTIPNCTSLIAPLNNATNVSTDTNISWNTITNATGYLITVGTTGGGIEVLNNIDVGNQTFYNFPDGIEANRLFFVTIIPYNDVGDATGCSEESFRTGNGPATIPNCTTLSSPMNGDTNVTVSTDISWNAITEATGYRLNIGTSSGGTDILNNEDVGNVTTLDLLSDLPETTTIFVTIISYNTHGDAVTCSEESFNTQTLATIPNCTTLISPMNSDTNVTIGTDISWNAITEATGYRLNIGTASGGTDILNNEDVGNVTTLDLLSDLPETTTVFVTIIPYNAQGDAVTCSEESFTTQTLATIPNCTTLISPMNSDTNVTIGTDISWNAITEATGYRLNIGTSSGGTDILNNEDVGNVTTLDLLSDLPESTTIFVTIISYNAEGDAVTCSEESFTTQTLATIPNCTTLSSPMNSDTNVTIGTDISWNAITEATGYRLNIGTASGGTDILNNEDVGNVTTLNLLSDLPETTTVFVTIIPYNPQGDAVTCSEESFTTQTLATIPNCTTLSSPMNGDTNVTIGTDISWNAITEATGYRLNIGTSSGGTDILNNEDVGNVTTLDLLSDLPETATIFVTIIPYNAQGDAVTCSEESFTTQTLATIPNCTTLSSPMNGDTNVTIGTDISWNAITEATGYRLNIGTSSGGTDILNNEDVGNVTTLDLLSDLPETATIFVTIIPYNAVGSMSCNEESFDIETILVESKYGLSPNGDGINDFWEIKGIEVSPDNTVNIYNRWGDLVFTISNYNNQSNVFRGEANRLTKSGAGSLPNGTYFFTIKVKGAHKLKKLKGYIVLKR